ncbi:MAG: hypothetical protein Q8S42_08390 [Archangium sp.]|nr:hypothetical protein [Archangium sp.]
MTPFLRFTRGYSMAGTSSFHVSSASFPRATSCSVSMPTMRTAAPEASSRLRICEGTRNGLRGAGSLALTIAAPNMTTSTPMRVGMT